MDLEVQEDEIKALSAAAKADEEDFSHETVGDMQGKLFRWGGGNGLVREWDRARRAILEAPDVIVTKRKNKYPKLAVKGGTPKASAGRTFWPNERQPKKKIKICTDR